MYYINIISFFRARDISQSLKPTRKYILISNKARVPESDN